MKMNASVISKSSKPWLIGLIVTATTLAGATFLWEVSQSELDKSSPPVQTAPITSKVTALGRLEPETEVIHLFAPIALDGDRVAQLLVKGGDWVESGQVIAILASRDRAKPGTARSRLAALEEATKEVKVTQKRLAQV